MKLTTETLDKAYLEYSNLTDAVTRKEIELAKEVERLRIAYQNASDQRQHYVDKCLRLSEVFLEFASTFKGFTGVDGYERANLIFSKHKDLLNELEHNLEDKK